MDNKTKQRLSEKYAAYGNKSAPKSAAMPVAGPGPGRGGRDRAMGGGSKPKNTRRTIVRLIKYLSFDRVFFVIAIICSLINTVAALVASYMLRPIMNKFLYFDAANPDTSKRIAGLIGGLALMAAVYATSIITQYLQQRIMLRVSQNSLKRMRGELFNKLQTLPIRYFDTHAAGDIMSRFTNDIDALGEMLNTTLIHIVSGIIMLIGTVFLMLYTNLILGGITIVLTPILMLVTRTILKKGRAAYSKQQRCLGMINGFAEETIAGQKIVKVFNHEQTAVQEFEYLNDELCEAQIRAQFRSGIMGPVTHQLCNISYAVTACVGAILVATRGFDIGGLAISINYTRRFNQPINEISMQMNTVFSALAGAERVFEVLDETPESISSDDEITPEKIRGNIVIKNVNFGYTPGVPVLHDISLYAKPGQKIAFVGSTGAGKTTVTNLLSRFYDTISGSITVDDIPIEKINRAALRQNIAMVLQDTHLFSGTVRENIRYGRLDATDDEVITAAKAASAHDFIMNLKDGYDTVLENDGSNLSQGQRQLLSIARAAISRAPILILDEATSSVDTRTERLIENGMDALMENRTTFVIAHRLSTVRKADAIMVLEKGRIIERGTHEELLKIGGRYSDLYNEIAQLE